VLTAVIILDKRAVLPRFNPAKIVPELLRSPQGLADGKKLTFSDGSAAER
jgi:hypothetical protein